jgi:hypothetical protein
MLMSASFDCEPLHKSSHWGSFDSVSRLSIDLLGHLYLRGHHHGLDNIPSP